MIVRVTNGFDKLTDAELESSGQTILLAMTGNTNFPTPTPTLAELSNNLTVFSQAAAVARKGSSLDKAIRDDKRDVFISTLHLLGNYVTFVAAGNRTVAASSAMPLNKDSLPRVLTKPENLRLSEGTNSGELKLAFDAVPAARSFQYQVTTDPLSEASQWQSFTGTTCRFLLTGLTPGQKYWVRVVAVGTGGQSITSDAVCRMVV